MRFAIVDKELVEASTKLQGLCPGCSQPVVAKCGITRVHHWAHKREGMCDDWWEPETEWHRNWKNKFPSAWQEIFLPDILTGENHIADVRTSDGLIIEFQHSHINPKERSIREKFYQTMVWIVDGTRLKRDFPRFLRGRNDFHSSHKQGLFYLFFPEDCFPSAWLESSVPVLFDFLGTGFHENIDLRSPLYCLFPIRIGQSAVVAEFSREAFINSAIKGKWLSRVKRFLDELEHKQKELDEERRRAGSNWLSQYLWSPRYKRSRRF